MSPRIDVSDLVTSRLRHRIGGRGDDGTLDCYGAVLLGFRRMGRVVPSWMRLDDNGVGLDEYIARAAECWEPIDQPELGAMLAWRNPEGPADHVAIVVDTDKRLAFTSEHRFGPRLTRYGLLRAPDAIYRYREPTT